MKSLIVAGMLSVTTSAMAAMPDLNNLNKELEIMSGVLHTAFKQDNNRRGLRFRSVDASYLAQQGVVFNISTSGKNAGLVAILDSVVPIAPIAYATSHSDDDFVFSFDFDSDTEWEHIAEDAVHQVHEAMREMSEDLRRLREEGREIVWENREYERELRDLKFRLRTSDGEEEKELEQEVKQLEKELAKVKEKKAALEERAEKLEVEQKVKLNEQKEAKEKAYKQFLANFEGNVGDTLCSFGAGLRALPKDEHISFVLKDFSRDENGKSKDRVYVFSYDKVKRCVQEKIDANALLSSAHVYEF